MKKPEKRARAKNFHKRAPFAELGTSKFVKTINASRNNICFSSTHPLTSQFQTRNTSKNRRCSSRFRGDPDVADPVEERGDEDQVGEVVVPRADVPGELHRDKERVVGYLWAR